MIRPWIRRGAHLSLFLAFGFALGSLAAQSPEDAKLIREIEDTLIAPCCWNQPISQHYSEVSEQMRQEVRAMVAEGKSKRVILDHYVEKYGERILATPRARGINALAYILPWAVLCAGAWGLVILLRKRRRVALAAADATLSAADASLSAADASLSAADARYDAIIEKELKELDE